MIDKLTQRKSGILVEYASCPRTYSNKFGVIFSEGVVQAHKLRLRRDSTQASQILIGRNCLLSYKASHWERGKFKRALLSRREI